MRLLRCVFSIFAIALSAISCQPEPSSSADLFSAVPKKSGLIIETRNLAEALKNISSTRLYNEMDSLPPVEDLRKQILLLKSQFAEDSLLRYLENRPLLIAAALSGAEKFDLLFLSSADPDFEQSIGKKMSRNFNVKQKTYAEANIFQFSHSKSGRQYFVSSYQDVILLSTSPTLVEEGIRQINSQYNLKNNADFQKLYETSNKKDIANIYLNLQEMPDLLKELLPQTEPGWVNRFGSWTELDLQVKNQEVIMSGLSIFPETEAHYLQSFMDVDAQKSTAQEIVPLSSGLWVGLTFANAEQYYRNYEHYLERAGRLRRHEQLLEKLEFNAEELLLHWIDSEMGIFVNAGKLTNQHVAYFKYRSKEQAEEKLEQLASPDFIEGYRGVIIKKLKPENALPRMYGSLFEDFHFPYFIVTNGFVLFSENLAVLKGVINDILDDKSLADDKSFQNFNNSLPDKAHLKVVAANPGFLPVLANALEKDDAAILEKQREKLTRYQWAALQLNVDDYAAFTNFYLLHTQQKQEKVNRLWSTQLETEAANTPQFLKNHVNKRYDIAIQDKDHRLYLLDYNGKILWTRMLDGPIMGNITQLDVYKNNKLQMVLNTPNTLYLIDRLGRDVENFPVKLSEAATAPVGVFNYDQARNYRLVVPVGSDLLNYSVEGKKVAGWSFKPSESAIITRPQHFSVARKDVIVVETESGKLLQLNRRGEKRFETIEGLPKLRIPFYLKEEESLSESQMLTIADDGKLYAIHPGGPADNLYLDEEYPADFFLYFDSKYIFSSGNHLFVKSDTKPWSATLEGDISAKPKAMILKDSFYAGAFSEEAEEIRLFNSQGELIEGFPVFAQGPFDMGSLKLDGSINVVTYSEDGTLICYRID